MWGYQQPALLRLPSRFRHVFVCMNVQISAIIRAGFTKFG